MICHFFGVMATFLILKKKKKTIIYAWKFHDQLQLWKIQITLIFLQAALLFFAQELFEMNLLQISGAEVTCMPSGYDTNSTIINIILFISISILGISSYCYHPNW